MKNRTFEPETITASVAGPGERWPGRPDRARGTNDEGEVRASSTSPPVHADNRGRDDSTEETGYATVRLDVAEVLNAVRPRALCDSCLATILGLPNGQAASRVTRYLQGEFGYRRTDGKCTRCGEKNIVIWRR